MRKSNKKLLINCDGGCRANPGPSGLGCVVYEYTGENKLECIYEKAAFQTRSSNNAAEYGALLLALEYVNNTSPSEVEILSDSRLIVEQINKVWQVKAPELIELNKKCTKKLVDIRAEGTKVTIRWVPREQNQHADTLANLAMDRKTGCEYHHNIDLSVQTNRCLEAMIVHERAVLDVIKYPKHMRNKRQELAETWEEVVNAWADMKVTF
jgi:ribonuclease HI